ncbi:4'-phosphopantetheinyl transferase superfamily protein [Streptomyces sp. RY43-2]|uniref:4'-phosphopantetheinyl transferase superfamily protein n=1 Tax=Streptomyces macrolidinus TaxID=2952607 RepID=A0ABT0ZFR2_9ACTN|nr:4'-phosphopantetheinyl transferase superfamily protein [Streptomyces macrolidinus]MCN9242402.1 4'-phosphopantetheinyl transferase superfamily protein [Streptomyces macrolidinus]
MLSGPSADWSGVRADLRRHGAAVVCARPDDWRTEQAGGPRLRALLGHDWERYRALTHPLVRTRFAASRLLLKSAAAAALGVRPEAVELGYSLTGRPGLRGYDGLDISLSHTDDLLLVGLAGGATIGVDAERGDRALYGPGLGRHLCTPYERERIEALPAAERNPAVLRLWTLKEAYTKALGLGLLFRFTDFGFSPDRAPTDVLRPDGTPATVGAWAFHSLSVADHTLAVAVRDAGFGHATDTTTATALDPALVDALTRAPGEEEPAGSSPGALDRP